MPEIDEDLHESWADTHARYREVFGETFCSIGVVGRPDAMRESIDKMRAALDGKRSPVRDAELNLDVPPHATI